MNIRESVSWRPHRADWRSERTEQTVDGGRVEVRMNDCGYIMTKLFRQGNQSFNGNVSQLYSGQSMSLIALKFVFLDLSSRLAWCNVMLFAQSDGAMNTRAMMFFPEQL